MINDPETSQLPVAVIGAGPVGLAAAAELIARDLPVIVLEAGDRVGDNIRQWAHVRMFSPWRFNISRAARMLLASSGWQVPEAKAVPTGASLLSDYLEPLASLPMVSKVVQLQARVLAVSRFGLDKVRTAGRNEQPFLLRVARADGEIDLLARAVIDCTGTFSHPNHGGAHGVDFHSELSRDFHREVSHP